MWGKESGLTKWLEMASSLIRARTTQIASIEGRSLVGKMTSCWVCNLYTYNTDETNVLTGEPCPSQVGDDYRLTSGNRILHSARHNDQGQQLILG